MINRLYIIRSCHTDETQQAHVDSNGYRTQHTFNTVDVDDDVLVHSQLARSWLELRFILPAP